MSRNAIKNVGLGGEMWIEVVVEVMWEEKIKKGCMMQK